MESTANFTRVPVINVHKENIAKFQPVIVKDIQVRLIIPSPTNTFLLSRPVISLVLTVSSVDWGTGGS